MRAVAVVVEKPGAGKVAIVACDVLWVTRAIVDAAAAEIERTTGLPASHLLVNATHTHHAPGAAPALPSAGRRSLPTPCGTPS